MSGFLQVQETGVSEVPNDSGTEGCNLLQIGGKEYEVLRAGIGAGTKEFGGVKGHLKVYELDDPETY